MFPTKFCSQCGEKIKRNRSTPFAFPALCSACKKQAPFARFIFVTMFISIAIGSFLVGRLTAPRQQFHFIGAPIDLQNAPGTLANEASANHQEASAIQQTTSSAGEAMCGAPTKAGRPCRRKVRGGGYCYQHKDKFKAPSNATK